MKRIAIKLGAESSEIVIGAPLEQLPAALKAHIKPGSHVAVVSDSAIAGSYGKRVSQALSKAGFQVETVIVPSGERSKTLREAQRLYRFCARAKLERQSWLVAVGGGVVGDLVGFVAATYLRGLSYVQVPTTLLAQVDAAIGGKTAVDLPEGKNLVGAFHQPRVVWIDPKTLRTLPHAHMRNGMAEIIKYAAIADANLFTLLEEHMEKLLKGPSDTLDDVIARCARIKARVVERDARETKGLRALLNFGHSVGHAIEAATDYKSYLHGEAVAIGMFVASFISQQMGILDPLERIRLGTLLTRAELPISVRRPIPRGRIMEHLSRDKKVQDGTVRFVLLDRLGKARSGQQVPPEVLEMGLAAGGLT